MSLCIDFFFEATIPLPLDFYEAIRGVVVGHEFAYNYKGMEERREGGPGVLSASPDEDLRLTQQGIQVQTSQGNHSSAIEKVQKGPVQLLNIRAGRLRLPDRMVYLNEHRTMQAP